MYPICFVNICAPIIKDPTLQTLDIWYIKHKKKGGREGGREREISSTSEFTLIEKKRYSKLQETK